MFTAAGFSRPPSFVQVRLPEASTLGVKVAPLLPAAPAGPVSPLSPFSPFSPGSPWGPAGPCMGPLSTQEEPPHM